jgi:SET domain-containing protein
MSAGETILEYKGGLVAWKEAQRRYERSAAEGRAHFFFDLNDGRVIDGAQGGNSARWVNHSCEPNCEVKLYRCCCGSLHCRGTMLAPA